MYVADKKEFMEMPEGTVYNYWRGEELGEGDDLFIKGSDYFSPTDYIEASLIHIIKSDCTGSYFEQCDKLGDGGTVETELDFGRNGMFDRDARYVIYEQVDLELIKEAIDQAIEVTKITKRK